MFISFVISDARSLGIAFTKITKAFGIFSPKYEQTVLQYLYVSAPLKKISVKLKPEFLSGSDSTFVMAVEFSGYRCITNDLDK